MAPLTVEDAKQWTADLRALLARPELRTVRWIVVETERVSCKPLLDAIPAIVEQVDARVDPQAATRDLEGMLAGMASAPPGATGPAALGAAGPKVAPPPRKGPPALPAAERKRLLEDAGVAPAYGDPAFCKQFRMSMLGAAVAMQQGNVVEAIRKQREARDLCEKNNMPRETVQMEMILGAMATQGPFEAIRLNTALKVYRSALDRAEAGQFFDLAVRAQFGIGATLLALKRHDEAAVVYSNTAQLAEEHAEPNLAIEAYRMWGQVAAGRGKVQVAAKAWNHALRVARDDPEAAQGSSAPQAARDLAAYCRKHGLTAQAQSLEAQAEALESPTTESGVN